MLHYSIVFDLCIGGIARKMAKKGSAAHFWRHSFGESVNFPKIRELWVHPVHRAHPAPWARPEEWDLHRPARPAE